MYKYVFTLVELYRILIYVINVILMEFTTLARLRKIKLKKHFPSETH